MSLTHGIKSFELENGLRVLLKQSRFAPLVSVWAWYHVGSKNEAPGITGASHWVEHMNFKGTNNISKNEIKGMIEKEGGFWNGYTFLDQTTYMETMQKEGLETALFLESERMHASLFDVDAIATERTVIISELRGNENDPAELLDREISASAFRAHPYGWPVIGWQSDIETMTREDLYNHYRSYYSPDNAMLVIVGDFEENDARNLIDKYYGDIPRWENGRKHVTTVEPVQRGERRVIVRREGTTPILQISYHAPGLGDEDFFALQLFNSLLSGPTGMNIFSGFSPSGSRSSRLYRELIDGNLAAAAGAVMLPTEHPYLYSIYSVLNAVEDFEMVENAIYQTIEDLIHRKVDKKELDKARTQLKAKLVFEIEGITNQAHQLGFYATIGHLDTYVKALDLIESLTLEDARNSALKFLGADNRTVGQFHPQTPEQEVN